MRGGDHDDNARLGDRNLAEPVNDAAGLDSEAAHRLALAVNGVLARDEMPLGPGAELALLPPVSGG